MTDTVDYKPTRRTRVKRLPKRGHYDRATVHAVLDAAVVAHVGYVIGGEPYVTPTAFWRKEDRVYWHGSSASRMLETIEGGSPVCFTVSLLDGFVMARSGFHHSINYRAVMAFGMARKLTEDGEKLQALEDFSERLFPGRWVGLRPVNRQELKATTVLVMDLEECSAKVRTGPPIDDDEDYALPIWAGVVPVRLVIDEAIDDERNLPGVKRPDHLNPKIG
jgi:nitroimidazol reductase NimA-like FMN-containing flavoprotein (pyridoxamine 5'-phosphate oxidase superfamily)